MIEYCTTQLSLAHNDQSTSKPAAALTRHHVVTYLQKLEAVVESKKRRRGRGGEEAGRV